MPDRRYLTATAHDLDGPFPPETFAYGSPMPAVIVDAIVCAGVVTTSAQRAYREARIDGATHRDALADAEAFAEIEDVIA